jgi:hypothetical protein
VSARQVVQEPDKEVEEEERPAPRGLFSFGSKKVRSSIWASRVSIMRDDISRGLVLKVPACLEHKQPALLQPTSQPVFLAFGQQTGLNHVQVGYYSVLATHQLQRAMLSTITGLALSIPIVVFVP